MNFVPIPSAQSSNVEWFTDHAFIVTNVINFCDGT